MLLISSQAGSQIGTKGRFHKIKLGIPPNSKGSLIQSYLGTLGWSDHQLIIPSLRGEWCSVRCSENVTFKNYDNYHPDFNVDGTQ